MRSSIPTDCSLSRYWGSHQKSQSLLNEVKYSNTEGVKVRVNDEIIESQSLLNEVKYSNLVGKFESKEHVLKSQSLLNEVKYSNWLNMSPVLHTVIKTSQSLLNEVKYSNGFPLVDYYDIIDCRNPF